MLTVPYPQPLWRPMPLRLALGIAILAAPAVPATVSAAATCGGVTATIVGTAGDDTIKGTRRRDVIVAKAGKDTIAGRGGRDRICAGGGADSVDGGVGNDRLSGSTGNDAIRGGDGDDRINGGDGFDDCDQGAGTGAVKGCEQADLEVSVDSANNVDPGDITFTVEVTNNGPDAAPYTLALAHSSQHATCATPPWEGSTSEPLLGSGATRSAQYVISCTPDQNGAHVSVEASVTTPAHDPDIVNDSALSQSNIKPA
jgi:hypothetical protein